MADGSMLIVTVGPSARLTDNLRLMLMRSKQTNTKIERCSFMFRGCRCNAEQNLVERLLSGHATKYYTGGKGSKHSNSTDPWHGRPARDYSPVELLRQQHGPAIIRRLSTTRANTGGT